MGAGAFTILQAWGIKYLIVRGKYIIGIDEVGRGCLAGPVLVVAALFRPGFRLRSENLGEIRDSKKLTELARNKWAKYLKERRVDFAAAKVSPSVIDRINISQAANLAALRAFNRLLEKNNLSVRRVKVFLDGGLYLGRDGKRLKFAKTVIKGDEKIQAIAAASIFAKVGRDRLMRKLAKKYPKYGLDIHKGYGTKMHLASLRKHGPSEIHRQSFISNLS